jgi:hypothetical protein
MDTSRVGLVLARCGVLAAALAAAVPRASAQRPPDQTMAGVSAPDSVRKPINVTAVSGVGATASEAQAGGNAAGAGATVDPAANGMAYDFKQMIGPQGGMVRALGLFDTARAGALLRMAYPNAADSAVNAGLGLRYTVNVVNDKVAAAKGGQNGQFAFPTAASTATSGVTTASSRGNETVTVDPANANAVDAFGLAQASLTSMKGGPPGFAIAFVKDPITFQLTDPTMAGSVTLGLGGTSSTGSPSPITLTASGPDAVAAALVDFGINGNLLAEFDLVVTSSMTSRSQVEVEVGYLSPSLGYASDGDFAAWLLSNFSFTNDGTTATLTGADVPLATINLAPGSSPVGVELDVGAVVTVPEPAGLALLGSGLAALASIHVRRPRGIRAARNRR